LLGFVELVSFTRVLGSISLDKLVFSGISGFSESLFANRLESVCFSVCYKAIYLFSLTICVSSDFSGGFYLLLPSGESNSSFGEELSFSTYASNL